MHIIIILHLIFEKICATLRGATTAAVRSAVVIIISHTLMKLADCGIIIYENIQKL